MKKITLENYRTDKFYPRIVRAVEALLSRGDVVAPIEVFIEMKLLTTEAVDDWRRGRVPCLERVIQCNLSAASRVLRILQMHVHDLNLRPSITVYHRWGKGPKTRLRFSRSGEPALEEAYSRHFIRVRSKRRERDVVTQVLNPNDEDSSLGAQRRRPGAGSGSGNPRVPAFPGPGPEPEPEPEPEPGF
ncbi:MAG: hypothetical protein ACXW5J_27470 [Thermoanaerobaculia bacterium]